MLSSESDASVSSATLLPVSADEVRTEGLRRCQELYERLAPVLDERLAPVLDELLACAPRRGPVRRGPPAPTLMPE